VFDCEKCGVHGENLVRHVRSFSLSTLMNSRTMAHIASRARRATCGSTVNAMGSQ
jgi:hypothetical protein